MYRRLSAVLASLSLLSLLGPAGLRAHPAHAASMGSLYFRRGLYIYVANADGSNVRQFSSTGTPSSPDGYPAVSYDGTNVAYTNPRGKIYVVSLASGRGRALAAPRGVRNLAWSPSGLVLAFDAPNGPGGMSAIGNVPADGSYPYNTFPEQHPRAHPSWADGFTIVASEYLHTPARWDIINLSYRPGDETYDKNIFDSPKVDYHDSAVAYDGKTFGLIVAARGAARGDLDVSPLGGNYVKIAHKVPLGPFCFSPDASMVAFVKGGALYTAPVDGSATPRRVLTDAAEPAWAAPVGSTGPTLGRAIRTVPVGDFPNTLALGNDGQTVYVLNQGSDYGPTGGSLDTLDGTTGLTRTARIVLGGTPNYLGMYVSPGPRSKVFVSYLKQDKVVMLGSPQSPATATIDGPHPFNVAFDAGANHALVSFYGTFKNHAYQDDGNVTLVDLTTGAVVATVKTRHYPSFSAVDTSLHHAFVLLRTHIGPRSASTGPGTLVMLDSRTGALLHSITVARDASLMDVSPLTHRVFLIHQSLSTVDVIDANTGALARTVTLAHQPTNVAVDDGSGHAFVTNADGDAVSLLDSATGDVITTTAVGTGPGGIAFDPMAHRAFVLNYGKYDSNGNMVVKTSVSVLDDRTGALVGAIPTDGNVQDMAMDTQTGRLFLLNQGTGTGTISVLTLGGA